MTKYVRGSDINFEVSFVDLSGDPLVPVDTSYPMVEILDPNGISIASGTGIQSQSVAGSWSWTWPSGAGSSLEPGWGVKWTMADANLQSYQQQWGFELYDQIENPLGVDQDGSYLTMIGKEERVIYKTDVQPLTLVLEIRNFLNAPLYTKEKENLTEVFADGYWNYYWDTPKFTNAGSYLVVWSERKTTLSSESHSTQMIRIPPDTIWYVLPYFRKLIDKLNKAQTTPLSYTDSELYQYLEQGCNLLNGVYPLTTWDVGSIPSMVWSYWILAAGIWALNSRQLLEIEITHNFTGQSVSLDYTKVSELSEVMSRWETMLFERFPSMKLSLSRTSNGVGAVGVRPYRLGVNSRVFRVATNGKALENWPAVLSNLGLTFYV